MKAMLLEGLVSINPITPAKPNDSRGATYELWKQLKTKQVTVYVRHQGQTFGEHFHAGTDPSKKPERLFLAQGKIKATFIYMETGRSETVEIVAGNEINISPRVGHVFTALKPVVIVEQRSTVFDKNNIDCVSTKPSR